MSIPPGQPPGQDWFSPMPPPPPPPSRRGVGPWPRRHPILFTLLAASIVVVFVIGAFSNSQPHQRAHDAARTTSSDPAGSPGPSVTASATRSRATVAVPLACHLSASSKSPRDRSTFTIRVKTAAHARVTVKGPLAPARDGSRSGHASSAGERAIRLRVGDAAPGVPIVIAVHVFRHHRSGMCRLTLQPRRVKSPRPIATSAPPPPTPTSCHPLTDGGNCYEPGEYCRDTDHGVTGVAGDGETIRCEDNNGWRWEPV